MKHVLIFIFKLTVACIGIICLLAMYPFYLLWEFDIKWRRMMFLLSCDVEKQKIISDRKMHSTPIDTIKLILYDVEILKTK